MAWYIDPFDPNVFIQELNSVYTKEYYSSNDSMKVAIQNTMPKCSCTFHDHPLSERTILINKNCLQHMHYLELDNKIADFVKGEVTMTVFKQLAFPDYFTEQVTLIKNDYSWKILEDEVPVTIIGISGAEISLSNNTTMTSSNFYIPNDLIGMEIKYSNNIDPIVLNNTIYDFSIGDWWKTKDGTQLKVVGLDLETNIVKVTSEGAELKYAVSYGISGSFVQSWTPSHKIYGPMKPTIKVSFTEPEEELSPLLIIMEQYSRTEEK